MVADANTPTQRTGMCRAHPPLKTNEARSRGDRSPLECQQAPDVCPRWATGWWAAPAVASVCSVSDRPCTCARETCARPVLGAVRNALEMLQSPHPTPDHLLSFDDGPMAVTSSCTEQTHKQAVKQANRACMHALAHTHSHAHKCTHTHTHS